MQYDQGYSDGYMEGRNTTGGSSILRRLLQVTFRALYLLIVLMPLLIIAYRVAVMLNNTYSNNFVIRVGLIITFTYLLYAIVYWLKGIIIGLKDAANKAWLLIWIICVVLTCGLQILMMHYQIEVYLQVKNISNYSLWSWVAGIAIGIAIYRHYRFLTNIAPRSVFWAYQFGFDFSKRLIRSSGKAIATCSPSFLGNSKMTISYKRNQ